MSGYAIKRDSGLFIGDVDNSPASGTINITENGTDIDVARYAKANVNVPQPSGKINITENGTNIDIADYALADVNVQQPDIAFNKRIGIQGNSYSVEPNTPYEFAAIGLSDYAFYEDDRLTKFDGTTAQIFQYIGAYCFCCNKYTSHLSEVILSDSYYEGLSIREYAFANCRDLHSLNLKSATQIEDYCFSGSGVQTIYLSTKLRTLRTNTFSNATHLTDIYYSGYQSDWENITNYNNCGLDSSVTIHYNYTGE